MGSLSHEGGKARQQHLGPPRDAGMCAWVRNTPTEAELWALRFRQGAPEGRLSGFLCSPRAKRSHWLTAQRDVLTARDAPGWKVVVRGGGEFPML